MVKTSDARKGNDVPRVRRLDRPRDGRVATERHVGAVFVVVRRVRPNQSQQVTFAVPRMVLFAPVIGFDADVAQGYRDLAAAARVGAFDPRPSWLERMASPGFSARDPEGAARVLAASLTALSRTRDDLTLPARDRPLATESSHKERADAAFPIRMAGPAREASTY